MKLLAAIALNKISLRSKARLYRWTGIYLAQKEEAALLGSELTIARAKKLASAYGEDLQTGLDVEIGMWQGQNGFIRPFSSLYFAKPYWFWTPIANMHCSLLAIKFDTQKAIKRLKRRLK